VKASAKSHPAYRVLSGIGVPTLLRRTRGAATIFCFHNVVPADDAGRGDRSLHLDVGHFETLLRWIARAYHVVHLSELVDRAEAGRAVKGLAALTFDDAYVGTLRCGLPVLNRLGLPATLYVVAESSRAPRVFWWDELAERGLLSDHEREKHLAEHQGLAARIRDASPRDAGDPPETLVPESMLPESWQGIGAALKEHDLVTVGSHTVRHPNLTALPDHELRAELEDSRARIADALGEVPETVSYPYGLHDQRVREAAKQVGYRAGTTLGPGLVRPHHDLLDLPRLNVPASIGLAALECWAVGLHPPQRP
jgi:peptidoglycan/xylan/chitin deacetylase (PgdA/CDA1 family)